MRDYQKLDRQDKNDALRMAHANANYLHHCIGTYVCPRDNLCAMCTNAARLAIQYYRPILERRFVGEIGSLLGVPTGYSPPCSD